MTVKVEVVVIVAKYVWKIRMQSYLVQQLRSYDPIMLLWVVGG